MKKRPEIAEFLKTLKTVQPRRKLSFDQILKDVQNNTVFGLLIVDIHLPTELQPLFAEPLLSGCGLVQNIAHHRFFVIGG